jgi:hypothetical protein
MEHKRLLPWSQDGYAEQYALGRNAVQVARILSTYQRVTASIFRVED